MLIRILLFILIGNAFGAVANSRADELGFENHTGLRASQEAKLPAMISIRKSAFLMGSPIDDEGSKAHRRQEKPQHEVTVNEFAIGRFLVTAEEFCQFLNVADNHIYFQEQQERVHRRTIKKQGDRYVPQVGAERCPAFPVTWVGADAYCQWLSNEHNKPFRLPSEAEWELVARGKELRSWPWGNEPPTIVLDSRPLVEVFHDSLRESLRILYRDDPKYRPMQFYQFRGATFYDVPPDYSRPWLFPPVGSFPLNATPEGVYDMLGYHFGQWCIDIYDEQAYSRSRDSIHMPADKEAKRSLRGLYAVGIVPQFAKQDRLPLRLVLLFTLAGDAAWDRDTLGRTWSRAGGHPTNDHGVFRIAMSISATD
jgi:formylglycine-generating enzyme required for sulfatase activity